MSHHHDPEPAWLHGHAHDPNPEPSITDPTVVVHTPDHTHHTLSVADLQALPAVDLPDCWIVSTGHGASGPFTFRGVRLLDLLNHIAPPGITWQWVDVISADGFGTRLFAPEVQSPTITRPIVLSYAIDGIPLTRTQGLVRLIVPSETDDALRQVKWVQRIELQ
jgi:DMSO/TMAO reductase YedYZ molybdopterin-dependent catalytic subunit